MNNLPYKDKLNEEEKSNSRVEYTPEDRLNSTKECPNTISGKHMVVKVRRKSISGGEILGSVNIDVYECIACGLIDDTHERGSR